MIKHLLLAATAMVCTAAPALAQAVPADIELEGIVLSWDGNTRILDVMGNQVFVPATATTSSPAATRGETGLSFTQWFRGLQFPGRGQVGFMGGTAIVTGTYDFTTNRIVADDVVIEPGENVSLGVITSSFCTTVRCDGPGDYLRGNTSVTGDPGPAMLRLTDPRMPAGEIGDEGGFALSLAGVNLNGFGYVAEGYYGSNAVPTNSSTGPVSQRAFHYFKLDLLTPHPELLQNKTIREAAIERAQCRVAKDFEVRGSIHSRVNPDGTINDTITPANGVVQVQYTLNGVLNRANSAVATPIAAGSPIGGYRVRFNVAGACPSNVTVRWLPLVGSNNANAYASAVNFPVDVRLD